MTNIITENKSSRYKIYIIVLNYWNQSFDGIPVESNRVKCERTAFHPQWSKWRWTCPASVNNEKNGRITCDDCYQARAANVTLGEGKQTRRALPSPQLAAWAPFSANVERGQACAELRGVLSWAVTDYRARCGERSPYVSSEGHSSLLLNTEPCMRVQVKLREAGELQTKQLHDITQDWRSLVPAKLNDKKTSQF